MRDICAPGDVRHDWFGSLRRLPVEDVRGEDPGWRTGGQRGRFRTQPAGPADDGYGQCWSAFRDCGDRVRQVADHALAVGLIGVEHQVQL